MINKWYQWVTKNCVFKSSPNNRSSFIEHSKEKMRPKENPNPKKVARHGVLFLLIDQTMPLQNLQDSLSETKRLFPNEMVFIVPLVPGCMEWIEKETTKQRLGTSNMNKESDGKAYQG